MKLNRGFKGSNDERAVALPARFLRLPEGAPRGGYRPPTPPEAPPAHPRRFFGGSRGGGSPPPGEQRG
eukprot:8511963-Alexandrium_andersonii.AAC.1